ncbi:uncharacterized protein DFL_007277 [Arthrobotrys flagrans]|uniref:Uncharacterized protein n=1 Tax=Arthrobotrys flagrans TaxID=97331 RepID=A0A436ZVX9_ARTFL|nr:hypothetical protein DFL_007277 [Arthrobotrys flagrans]
MALSEDLLKVIEKSALDEGSLNSVRDKLRACAGTPPWDIVTNLLGLLVSSSTAFNLPIGGSIVARKLFIMLQNIQDGSLEIEEFRPLIDVVVNSSRTDTDIWAAVIDLIEAVRPSTPQNFTAATPTFFGTPVKTSSSRLADSETREIVEKELFHEVKRCTFRNVKGFWDKFFDSESWDEERKAMLKGMMAEHDGRKWTGFPSTPDEKPVWEWLRSLEKRFLAAGYILAKATQERGQHL